MLAFLLILVRFIFSVFHVCRSFKYKTLGFMLKSRFILTAAVDIAFISVIIVKDASLGVLGIVVDLLLNSLFFYLAFQTRNQYFREELEASRMALDIKGTVNSDPLVN
jgi:hypothetical protein